MKKCLTIAAGVLMLAACSQKPSFNIAGTVACPDLNDQYVYLGVYGQDNQILDSAKVENGTFAFKGEQDSPILAYIKFDDDVIKETIAPVQRGPIYSTTFVLENGNINIALDSISTATGTLENDGFTAFQAETREINNQMRDLAADMRSESEEIAKTAEGKYEELELKLTEKIVNYILNNQNKMSAAKVLRDNRYNIPDDQQSEILAQADSAFKAFPGIQQMIDHLEVLKTVAPGNQFVDFEMADTKGDMRKLSDFVGNGKVVLIDFWASWCPPCRKGMPELVELYKNNKNKGFEIVGVSLDSKQDAWEKGIKDLNITWQQLSDLQGWSNNGAKLYGVNSIPTTVLVDKDGKIVARNLHGEELSEKINELLK